MAWSADIAVPAVPLPANADVKAASLFASAVARLAAEEDDAPVILNREAFPPLNTSVGRLVFTELVLPRFNPAAKDVPLPPDPCV